jgi:DNA-directed RNA polymerase subunit beta'
MGAEAVREALANVNLPRQIDKLQQQMQETKSKQIRKKLAKRIRLLGAFVENRVKPEWMILTVLPVIPPDLRPLVPLEGGRFATSDLNDLYRRVINRNNRLKNLLQLKTPEVIIRNEKRMLQEAVDALFDNGRHGRAVTGAGNRPLKSLSDMLKGKSGRFRQNLLGKRVDYSGRSVIVIGPELKLHQCGLPKKMALVLFEPFIIRRLKELGFVHTVRSAKKMIERQATEVWDILEEVTKGHPVLLNRAPTLHRLSIQAFEPMLIEGEAIRIHPLVCTAYNADFDGDQMAVHVPLSIEAQMEARLLMMAPNNIFSPSSGRPIMTPTQDITLGCFYLTAEPRQPKDPNKRLMLFGSKEEVIFAYREGELKTHSRVRLANPDYGRQTVYGDPRSKVIETTVGRVIFSEVWPERLGFFNKVAGKNELGDLIWNCYKHCGHDETIATLDRLKELGFREATRGEGEADPRGAKADCRGGEAVPQGRDHRRRAVQQDCGHLDALHRPDFHRHAPDPGAQPEQIRIQPHLPHGQLRRPRQQAAGAPVGRAARPHGQAQRRHHREADSLEFPRGADSAGILHLHARRAQGAGRHGAQDRRLRLHDPQAGGRGPGRDCARGGLQHGQRHLGAGHHGGRG